MNNQPDSRIAAMQQVIKNLRNDDLSNGHCFMIFDEYLPEDQSYYEYPDGRIQIEKVDEDNLYNPRTVIKILTEAESISVKERHEVFH